MFSQPDQICFRLPPWVSTCCNRYSVTRDPQLQMDFVIGAAQRNVTESTGGPFAAAVFNADTGELVSLGVNLVASEGLSGLHAEMVAITVAQRKLGSYDLGSAALPSHRLVCSSEPCAMCFGAIPWSGVHELVTGARDEDARAICFDEGAKPVDWLGELRERGIEVTTDVRRDEARAVLQDYLARGGPIYNSRDNRSCR